MQAPLTRKLRPALAPATYFTDPDTFPEPARTILLNSLARAKTALAEEFKGITADGGMPESSLFPIVKSGVSAQPIVDAARAFLALLSAEQRMTATFEVDSKEWRSWQNMHCFLLRHGLVLDGLNRAQREAASAAWRFTFQAANVSSWVARARRDHANVCVVAMPAHACADKSWMVGCSPESGFAASHW
jgi:hypothetical protein